MSNEAAARPIELLAPVTGTVVAVEATVGEGVRRGHVLVLLESMKMEVPVEAPCDARVLAIAVAVGEVVSEGQPLARVHRAELAPAPVAGPAAPAAPRADLQRLCERRALLDEGSFVEVGGFVVAAQRSRRSLDDLQRNTPADGLVCGTGLVQGRPVAALAYDYTVLAGTQGMNNHAKSDRVLELAERQRLPVVWFLEGGGGRPGDVDWPGVAGLDCTTFGRLAALSGVVPRLGLVAGRCFAGNAALLGCCDLIVAVKGASIGMGGPAMIEGGGLGKVDPDVVGPLSVMGPNGVVDLIVDDEAEAVRQARRLLALLTVARAEPGPAGAPAETLRDAVPENRNALYDPRRILHALADDSSLVELRPEFGIGVITALARIDGQAVALAASNPRHLGGALDAPACDKLARFMQLADAFGLPLVSFVDSPGFMVGPDSEKTAMVRHAARLFVNAAALRVPVVSVIVRRGYGLGAMGLTAGHFHVPVATVAWPGGEFGGMGLEGAVRLGFRKELEAAPEAEREALFQRLLKQAIDKGQALNMASHGEIDDVIDPAETRDWLLRVLRVATARPLAPRRPFVDAW